jgi:hypothetical protein
MIVSEDSRGFFGDQLCKHHVLPKDHKSTIIGIYKHPYTAVPSADVAHGVVLDFFFF